VGARLIVCLLINLENKFMKIESIGGAVLVSRIPLKWNNCTELMCEKTSTKVFKARCASNLSLPLKT